MNKNIDFFNLCWNKICFSFMSMLFWDIMQQGVVIMYWLLGQSISPIFRGQEVQFSAPLQCNLEACSKQIT